MEIGQTRTQGSLGVTHGSAALAEADRLMTICNACRYCEGLCAVFPAMEMRRSFEDADLRYLANLCHECGACHADCQFAPPHEFAVDVPKVLAEVRAESYAHHAWPAPFAVAFERNGVWIATIAAISVAAFVLGFVWWRDPEVLFGTHVGPGAFYRLMPHDAMAALFGAVFGFAGCAMAISLRRFWREISASPPHAADVTQATKDAASLRYLDGGGENCSTDPDAPADRRKLYHHLTFYGFALCFAATSVATLYHYVFGRIALYAWYDLPVVLGTLGGLGLIVGPIGLLAAKSAAKRAAMGTAFLVMLLATSVTGLALLALRATPAMGLLLALHLGIVFALFLTFPYGKFVHGFYRLLALARYAQERR